MLFAERPDGRGQVFLAKLDPGRVFALALVDADQLARVCERLGVGVTESSGVKRCGSAKGGATLVVFSLSEQRLAAVVQKLSAQIGLVTGARDPTFGDVR